MSKSTTSPIVTKQPASNARITLITLLPVFFVVLLGAWAYLSLPPILDDFQASRFRPAEEIVQIRNDLQLTERGEDLLYASRSVIQDGQEFNASCKTQERTAAILGCYYMKRIYLFDVKNEQLARATEVTAAHEMLHAAYDRLNVFERNAVDKQLKNEYLRVINTDVNLQKMMAYYEEAEPDDLINELHSILGTTVETLSPALEAHYAQYFSDRSAVVSMHIEYNTVFQSISKRADELTDLIDELEPVINASLAEYEVDLQQLQLDIDAFNSRASAGGFTNYGSFTAVRNALLARSADMNARRDEINQRVNEYNAYINELNSLSVRADELNTSINGAPAPAEV